MFEQRAAKLRRKSRFISFFGFFPLIMVGSFVAVLTAKSEVLTYIVIPITGIISIIQAGLSLWAMTSRWDEEQAYALSAIKNNTRLSSQWEKLSKDPIEAIELNIEKLRGEDNHLEGEDTAQYITDREKHFAMRSTLFQYRLQCVSCGKTPESMKASSCPTCGKF